MTRSLTLRALVLAALTTGAALVFLWVLLTQLFEQRISQRYFVELEAHLAALERGAEPGPAGVALATTPQAPDFARPFSGLYWQVEAGGKVLTSRSLWDEVLVLPRPRKPGQIVRHVRLDFGDGQVMAAERVLVVGEAEGLRVRIIAAIDRAGLESAKDDFGKRVLTLVAVLGLFLMLATGVQIYFGFRPLKTLRTRLNAVRSGQAERLEGPFPTEVDGLVDEVNRLLSAREEMVSRARARAGDLAHGLKTPLAVLGAEARRLESAGEAAAAAEINAQIDRMHRNVERELVRARAASSGSTLAARTKLEPAIERMLRAFRRMPGGEDLDWSANIPEDLVIAMDSVDLDEVSGTLLDNARKWATGRVQVIARSEGGQTVMAVEDDGPGVPDAELEHIVERGRRLDEATPGTGLGLAIARDILELYGGALTVSRSELGGLSVTITVPLAVQG